MRFPKYRGEKKKKGAFYSPPPFYFGFFQVIQCIEGSSTICVAIFTYRIIRITIGHPSLRKEDFFLMISGYV